MQHAWRAEKCIQYLCWKTRREETSWRIWDYNIKMDLREIGWKVADWIYVKQGPVGTLVNAILNFWAP
jgi:hypothetical protein